MFRCPGQDQRLWKPEDIFEVPCPDCSYPLEFFKDEPTLKCRKCGRVVVNSRLDLGCAEWCRHAEQCAGASSVRRVSTVREKLLDRMKAVFGQDGRRIAHALAVLAYAEEIAEAEGAEPLVVKAAAILHDIGIHEAERKHGSTAGKYQEIEGPPIAREILEANGVGPAEVDHICRIIGSHHSARDIDTLEFRVIWDADWLVNLGEDFAGAGDRERRSRIGKIFRTEKGRQIATTLYLSETQGQCRA